MQQCSNDGIFRRISCNNFRYYRKRLLHDQVQQLVMWVSSHGVQIPVEDIFYRNVGVHGAPVPARAYMPELLDDILKGHINPGRVFDICHLKTLQLAI